MKRISFLILFIVQIFAANAQILKPAKLVKSSILNYNSTTHEAKLRLEFEIENAQKLKIENERSLLEQGRTTTYQILLFEQEYFRSQIKSLEIARQLLSLNAEAKSYKF